MLSVKPEILRRGDNNPVFHYVLPKTTTPTLFTERSPGINFTPFLWLEKLISLKPGAVIRSRRQDGSPQQLLQSDLQSNGHRATSHKCCYAMGSEPFSMFLILEQTDAKFSFISHSQTVITCQPEEESRSTFSLSRQTVFLSFSSQ